MAIVFIAAVEKYVSKNCLLFYYSFKHNLYIKDSEILCWDIRNIGQILHVINREVATNQRIYFDLSPDCKYLATGNDNGFISVYDISSEVISDDILKPINSFKAHNDCVNGVRY